MIGKLSEFLEANWDRKIWVLTTTIFSSCCAFLLWNASTLPVAYRDNIREAQQIKNSSVEATNVFLLFDDVQAQAKMFGSFLQFYTTNFPTNRPFQLDQALVAATNGIVLCSKLRSELASQIGLAEGMVLNTKDYQDFANSQLASSRQLDSLVANFSSYFESILNSDEKARSLTAGSTLLAYNQTINAMISRMATISTTMTAAEADRAERLSYLILQLKWLSIRFWFSLLPIIYAGLYVIFALRQIMLFRKVGRRSNKK